MKYVLTIIILLVVLGVGALLYAWSGIYSIAATEPHWAITSSFIDTLRDSSIRAHSEDIRAPKMDDENLGRGVFSHYDRMCRLCHGAPGVSREEFAEGLYPAPPSLTSGEVQEDRSDVELFWIVKHGIKMTGMPAFGPTHSDEELWGLVNLTKKIPQMSPEEYQQQVNGRAQGEEEDHEHGEKEEGDDHDHQN
jgi:mono/diheme cytochrome c family protein